MTINGPRRDGRSATRPATSFTSAAAASAAPSSAPSATAPPPSTPVTNAGSSGYTISLAKSLSSETAPNSLTCLGRGGACCAPTSGGLLTQAESPANQRDGQAAIGQHGVMEGAEGEARPFGFAEIVAQAEQLAPADRVAQLIRRPGTVAADFRFGVPAFHVQLVHHLIHGLVACHAAGMQADVEQNAHRAPQEMHALKQQLLVRRVEPFLRHHVFAVQRPAFYRQRRPEVFANMGRQLFRDHELQMMARIALVQRRGGELMTTMVAE